MSKTVIIAALDEELIYFAPLFRGKSNICLLKTGVGEKKTVFTLNHHFQKDQCDSILNIGTTGTLTSEIPFESIVIPDRTVNFDTGEECYVDREFRVNIENQLKNQGVYFYAGKLVTVRTPVMSEADREKIHRETGAIAVDMESHFVNVWARDRNIPAVVLRIVTDLSDSNAVSDFNDHLQSASKKLAKIIGRLEFH